MCPGLGTKHGRREVNKEKWQMKMASNCRYHHQLTAYCRRVAPCIPLLSPLFRSQPQPACLSIIQSVIHFSPGRAGLGQNASSAYLSTQTDGDVVIHARSLASSLCLALLQSLFRLHSRRHFWSALWHVCVCVSVRDVVTTN